MGQKVGEADVQMISGFEDVQVPGFNGGPAPTSVLGVAGRILGRMMGMGTSIEEIGVGGGAVGISILEDGSIVLAPVGIAQGIAGFGVAAYGALIIGNILKPINMSQVGSGSGSGGQQQPNSRAYPPLKRLHSDKTLESGSNKYGLASVRKMTTQQIVDSLKPGAAEPLTVKLDGTVMDGNTRVKVLEERGYDINSLPRTPAP